MTEMRDTNVLVQAVPVMILTKDDVIMTTAQDSVKEQLLQRALPVYTPTTANQEFSFDQLFCCKDCGDKFLLESSLVRHIERLSVSIKYCCSLCNKTLMFYNRCRLLAHMRNHSEVQNNGNNSAKTGPAVKRDEIICNGEVEPDSLSLSPLPKEKIPLGPFIPLLVDEHGRLIPNKDDTKKCTADAHTQVTEKNITSETIVSSKINEVTHHIRDGSTESRGNDHSSSEYVSAVKETTVDTNLDMDISDAVECKECGTVSSTGDIKEHFIGTNTPVNAQFKCKTCSLILPTLCSLQAHNRIHTQTKPYICPECSREFELWASFSVHLAYTCFHLAKVVRYRCNNCKKVFPTAVMLEVHLLTQHVKNVYKCNACPIACFSVDALTEHKLNIHKQNTSVTQSYQQCQLCPDRLIPKSRVLLHINEHCRDPSVRVYVYQCKCNFSTQKKTDFATHKSLCTKNDKTAVSIVSPTSEKNSQNVEIPVLQQKVKVPVNNIQNNNNNQQKVFIPLDSNQNSNVNNYVKILYGVPQANKTMHLTLVPKNLVRTFKKVNWPKTYERKILPKFTVDQICLKESANSTPAQNNVSNSEDLPAGNNGNEEAEEKNYVYMTEKRCETNAEQAEHLLSTMASDSKIVKDSPNHEPAIALSPSTLHSFTGKHKALLRVCALCKKELVAVPQRLGVSNFQALCFKCSKSHTFLKSNNKLMIVSRDKIVSSASIDAKNINGKTDMVPLLNENKDLSSTKETNSNFEKTVNIALNGPSESKISNESTGSNINSSNYRCHICKDLVSMEWKKIQEHFAEKHPNFNFLVLSPKVDKLNIASLKVPFIIKDNKIYPKDDRNAMSDSCNDEDTNKIDSNDESDNIEDDFMMPDVKKEWDNNSDGGESLENEGFNERYLFMKRERDIPIDYDLIPSKLKKKKRSHKTAEVPSTPFSSGQILPPLEQISGDHNYECAKCQYSDDNIESFHKHIVKHRTDKNVIQCMECGLCFVVKPSFEKHLFISHRIKDVESYMQKNNCYNDKDDNKAEEITLNDGDLQLLEDTPDDLVENQCRVCREIFESAFELSKHFRTHGMAFLLMKKRENKTP